MGGPNDFDDLPEVHREQILFLDKSGEKFISDLSAFGHLTTGSNSDPFAKGNFKTVDRFSISEGHDSEQSLKKWLYHRNVAFKTWVFLLPDMGPPIVTTWKIIVKYAGTLFFAHDIMVFDKSLEWCMYYYHNDELFFGKEKFYDPTEDIKKMEVLNELKRKFPQAKFAY